jgi:UDP-glucuronate 4-epimerase
MAYRNILVTGGAGFIGSNLIDHFLNIGHRVVCIDNFEPNYSRAFKQKNIESALSDINFKFIEGDVNNINDLRKCFLEILPDTVVHLAAKSGVRPSIKSPHEYYITNVLGTLNLLEVMKEFNVKRLLFASSSSVYGNNKNVPFSETDGVDTPISQYAATKKAAELLCHTYHHLYGFDIFCLRFFTVYGPRQRPDLAIRKFTENILNNKAIDMYGDGSTSRDYTYIDDIIAGIINSIEKLNGYEIINLGESKVIELRHMITTIEKILKKEARINQLPIQPGDVLITFANIEKAKRILDYHPKWKFEDGIKEFIKWMQT